MACFIVPTVAGMVAHSQKKRFPAHWHVEWLTTMIFGGAVGLAVEHFAHGEIVPWPPFLTAMANPADATAMFHEMALVGIPMTLALVAVWAVLVIAYNKFQALSKDASVSPAAV